MIMMKYFVYAITIALFILSSSYCSAKKKISSRSKVGKSPRKVIVPENNDPLETIADFLLRFGKGSALLRYSSNEVLNALKHLASTQNALKSMDGATHKLSNTLSDSTSLGARFEKFIRGKQKNMKEAGKLIEYVNTVERALQASELLQSILPDVDTERASMLGMANLVELKRFRVTVNKISVVVSILQPNVSSSSAVVDESRHVQDPSPQSAAKLRKIRSKPERYFDGEIIVAIVDGESNPKKQISHILRVMSQKLETVPIKAVGVIDEEVIIQPTLLRLANEVLLEVKDFISAPDLVPESVKGVDGSRHVDKNGAINASNRHRTSSKKKENFRSERKPKSQTDRISNAIRREPKDSNTRASGSVGKRKINVTRFGQPIPKCVRVVGHSCGGAVASYCAMLLDGSLNITNLNSMIPTNDSANNRHEKIESSYVNTTIFPIIGSYADRVRCVTLGSPPCVSRSLVPRYVTSIICGDDIVPRAYPESIESLRRRVLKALASGAGKGGFSWMVGAGWAKDLASIAGSSLKKYRARSRSQSRLSVPGRVFFTKARQLKEGASMQRVKRGNWREEMLWMLHDIMLSKRIIAHHQLDYYIQTLSRN